MLIKSGTSGFVSIKLRSSINFAFPFQVKSHTALFNAETEKPVWPYLMISILFSQQRKIADKMLCNTLGASQEHSHVRLKAYHRIFILSTLFTVHCLRCLWLNVLIRLRKSTAFTACRLHNRAPAPSLDAFLHRVPAYPSHGYIPALAHRDALHFRRAFHKPAQAAPGSFCG